MGEENSTTGAVITSAKNSSKQFYDLSLRYPSKQTTEYKGVRLNLPADDKFSFKGKNIWLPVVVERNKPVNIGLYTLYNWDRIYDNHECNADDNAVIRYLVDFSYTLTKNYPDTKEMSEVVLDTG